VECNKLHYLVTLVNQVNVETLTTDQRKPATEVKYLHFCLHIDTLFDMIDTFLQPTLKGSWFTIIPFHIKKINSIE
jgi:hypothetical protein